MGAWFAPEYDNGSGRTTPPEGLGVESDGTYAHNTSGVEDDKGTWSIVDDRVTLTGRHSHYLDPNRNCTAMNYDDGSRTNTYYRDDAPTGCPFETPPLTAEEKCLLGTFSETRNQNTAVEHFKHTRKAIRTDIFEQIYVGNGDATITEIYYWYIQDGQYCVEGVDQVPGCSPIDWAAIEATRTSAKDPGCVKP